MPRPKFFEQDQDAKKSAKKPGGAAPKTKRLESLHRKGRK